MNGKYTPAHQESETGIDISLSISPIFSSFTDGNSKFSKSEGGDRGSNEDFVKQQILPALKLPEKKSSKSLNDLCKQVDYELCSSKRNCPLLPLERCKYRNSPVTTIDGFNYSTKFARRCIVNLLMLNAWRRQKIGYKAAQEKIGNLINKVDSFEMQVYVLRQLLNAEKKRVEATNDNIQDLLEKIKVCNKEKTLVVKEKENLEKNCNKMLDYCAQMENALRNKENEICTSRLEVENWEKQLKKEREKLKEMESFLKERLQLIEKMLMLKTQQIEHLTKINRELQQKLDVQVQLWDETMAQVDLAKARLKKEEEKKVDLEEVLQDKEKEIKELKTAIACLERRLQEEDEKNGLLGKTITEKSNELTAIQAKFLELSRNSFPWSAGIIKAASFCAKIPVACLCTVGSLLLPFPSYRL